MFLFPCIGALVSDVLVILLHKDFSPYLNHDNNVWSIENTSYVTPLSVIRLSLLLPLIYHTYSGHRLKFPRFYLIFHVVSALIVSCHFIAFSLRTASTSISSHNDHRTHQETNNTLSTKQSPNDERKEMDVIWLLLTLSLVSIGLHMIILVHVRSTAPTDDAIQRKLEGAQRVNHTSVGKKRKMLAYWIYDRYRRDTHTTHNDSAVDLPPLSNASSSTRRILSMDHDNSDWDEFHGMSPPMTSHKDDVVGNENGCNQLRRRDNHRSTENGVHINNIVETFSDGYDGECQYSFYFLNDVCLKIYAHYQNNTKLS